MNQTFACPKCGRDCEICGSVWEPDAGMALPVYQCDNDACQTTLTMGGEVFPAAYTFVVGVDGRPFDPAVETDVRRN